MHFDGESESLAPNARQTPDTPTTVATRTPESIPGTSAEISEDAFKFALCKFVSKKLLASLTTKDAILKEVRHCVLKGSEERCKQVIP